MSKMMPLLQILNKTIKCKNDGKVKFALPAFQMQTIHYNWALLLIHKLKLFRNCFFIKIEFNLITQITNV